jgi:hypothetical protein
VLRLDVARTSHVLTPVTESACGDGGEGADDEFGMLESIHSGALYRKSDVDGSWHKRWFCLRGNRCLYFYKSDKVGQSASCLPGSFYF